MLRSIASRLNMSHIAMVAVKLDYKRDGSETLMAYAPNSGIASQFQFVADEIAGIRNQKPLNLMINIIPPGVEVPKHRDWLKDNRTVERWHLAVATNPHAYWWDEDDGKFWMAPGFWHGPVPYWRLHAVGNPNISSRLHIVVDLDTPTNLGQYD